MQEQCRREKTNKDFLDGLLEYEGDGKEGTDRISDQNAVVKETPRLHPPIPLLLPRNVMQETNLMGNLIPKDTQVSVNAWAIGRDTECWEDPMSFKPERFLGSNIEIIGRNFEFIPFGSGRRICVGISLAEWVFHLGVASLLHYFD
ncbi:hypothetical protein Ddye_008118 [Dipteronia dyeriana]|uniref:Cytochrome P450 n=1 Tax=Dipteronia dyeriana TaxID=168575 RepID=A0AAD9X8S8_9ROSI|nr:hypothetical protein Ddye_008118 [Dipteronia dyeriana]